MTVSNIQDDAYNGGGGSGSSGVTSVIGGVGVSVDSTNPAAPIVSASEPAYNVVFVSNAGNDSAVNPQNPLSPYLTFNAAQAKAAALRTAQGGAQRWYVVCRDASTFTEAGTISLAPGISLFAPNAKLISAGFQFSAGSQICINEVQLSSSGIVLYPSSIDLETSVLIGFLHALSTVSNVSIFQDASSGATPSKNDIRIGSIIIDGTVMSSLQGILLVTGNSISNFTVGNISYTGTAPGYPEAGVLFAPGSCVATLNAGYVNAPNLSLFSTTSSASNGFVNVGYANTKKIVHIDNSGGADKAKVTGWIDSQIFGFVNGTGHDVSVGGRTSCPNSLAGAIVGNPRILWGNDGLASPGKLFGGLLGSPNTLTDVLQAGAGISITQALNQLTIAATGGGGMQSTYAQTMTPATPSSNVFIPNGSSTQWTAYATMMVPEGSMSLSAASEMAFVCPQPVSGASFILAIYDANAAAPYPLVASSGIASMPGSSSWLTALLSNIVASSLVGSRKYFAVILWNGNGATVTGVTGSNMNIQPYLSWYKSNMGILAAAPSTISPEGEVSNRIFMRVKT